MLDFTTIPESPLPHFKDGKETFFARFAGDASCKILYGRLPAGATIGLHTHEDTAEIIFFCRVRVRCSLTARKRPSPRVCATTAPREAPTV